MGSNGLAQALRPQLQLPNETFRAVLAGKDGGAKLILAEPIPPRRLFSTIDAMLMRRNEMQRR